MNSYYEYLKDEINNFEGDFESYILYVPDFFKLLCSLVDEKIDKKDKKDIFSALAYFVIPNDIIPEDMYGPQGYVDDIFVCCAVLKRVSEKYGVKYLKRFWDQDESLEEVIYICYNKSKKLLEKKKLLKKTLKLAAL
jgi:uncharacterized membrane protein YkvA (DUF1232 family)